MRYLSEKSDRVLWEEYARSHEQRLLYQLIISHPQNIEDLSSIRLAHQKLCVKNQSQQVELGSLPAILQLAYTVHGNETSGMHAAIYLAYYLAAAESPEIDLTLKSLVIIIDPCMNPDGATRFTTWLNSWKNQHLVHDPIHKEFNEPWPGSRGNHYFFDLNRDYLFLTQPESRGRIKSFYRWTPNIYCDFHEMGPNTTYFFQPGVPSRVNPLTPTQNQQLTARIAQYHAAYLDEIGSLYYSKEDFDDYFYGKGSTFPDAVGSIGILFEQASSRGHSQMTKFGRLDFPFTVRNQIRTSMSSIKAAADLRMELLQYKKDFFITAIEVADADPVRGYLCDFDGDLTRVAQFLYLLYLHEIQVYKTKTAWKAPKHTFPAGSFYIPVKQKNYRLIKSMFEGHREFTDSVFYDISTWNLPMSYGAIHYQIPKSTGLANEDLESYSFEDLIMQPKPLGFSKIGYIIPWSDASVPSAINSLLNSGINLMVITIPSIYKTRSGELRILSGDLFVPSVQGERYEEQIHELLLKECSQKGITVYPVESVQSIAGVDLGSPTLHPVKKPNVLLVGSGNSTEVGEIWHHLDQKIGLGVAIVDPDQWNRIQWSNYSHLFMVGSPSLSENQIQKLKDWISGGGILCTWGMGNAWIKSNKIIQLQDTTLWVDEDKRSTYVPYAKLSEQNASKQISGSIFQIKADLTHPIFYGIRQSDIPIFHKGNQFYKPPINIQSSPAVYSPDYYLSGYLPKNLNKSPAGLPALQIQSVGQGKVISLFFNPLHRGHWLSTERIVNNILYFSSVISSSSARPMD